MRKNKLTLFCFCIIGGVIWSIILVLLGLFLSKFVETTLKDILFMEGVLVIIIGLFSSIGGNPMGLSLQALGQSNAQYVGNANLEISRMEKEKSIVKDSIKIGVSTISLILGGIGCIVINYII